MLKVGELVDYVGSVDPVMKVGDVVDHVWSVDPDVDVGDVVDDVGSVDPVVKVGDVVAQAVINTQKLQVGNDIFSWTLLLAKFCFESRKFCENMELTKLFLANICL